MTAIQHLTCALELFTQQYEGGPEREMRPEFIAARAALLQAKNHSLTDAIRDALTVAENIRKQTGGAQEGCICWTLRTALEQSNNP